MNKKRIVYAGGFWSTNIGNAFYNLGVLYLLKQLGPNFDVFFEGDQPGWFWSKNGKNPATSLDYLANLKTDYLIISGPMLSEEFSAIWGDSLEKLISKKTKIILLSAGGMTYRKDEIDACKKMLTKYRPYILSTRDAVTYDNYRNLADYSYNGICAAFFAQDFHKPIEMDIGPYFVYNYEFMAEPHLKSTSDDNYSFELLGQRWLIDKKSRLGEKIIKIFGQEYSRSIEKYKIVRTKHLCLSDDVDKLFDRDNVFISDVPHSYLNIYANSSCTFSDRVHACVATLAYGKPAMLFSKSNRSYLFDRLQAGSIRNKPTVLSLDLLNKEKMGLINFLKEKIV
jgi:Polysaccharide pyruvyl transferase